MYTFQKGILVLLICALLQNYTFVSGQSDGHICFMNCLIILLFSVWKCLRHEGGQSDKLN